ncbi:MAG TPA: CopD family protein [Actinomycetes bacterium]|nr:CopD family protein [Actinomycetes bacterium]
MAVADLRWGSLSDALMVLARLVATTAVLVLIGGIIFLAAVRLPSDLSRRGRWLDHRAHRFLWTAWLAALAGTIGTILLYTPSAANLPVSAVVDPRTLQLTIQSRYGLAAGLRLACLLLIAPMLLAGWPWPKGRRRTAAHRRPGWLVAAALLLTAPLGGHAGRGPDPVFGVMVGWLHFAAAATWLGGLILLISCTMRRLQVRLRDYVPQFSAIATISMLALMITGVVQSWRQLGSLAALTTTSYGQFLIVKCVAFAALMLIALRSHNLTKQAAEDPVMAWRRAGPGAKYTDHDTRNARRLRQLVVAEVVVAVTVLLATELMAQVAPGRDDLAQRQRDAVVRERTPLQGVQLQQRARQPAGLPPGDAGQQQPAGQPPGDAGGFSGPGQSVDDQPPAAGAPADPGAGGPADPNQPGG